MGAAAAAAAVAMTPPLPPPSQDADAEAANDARIQRQLRALDKARSTRKEGLGELTRLELGLELAADPARSPLDDPRPDAKAMAMTGDKNILGSGGHLEMFPEQDPDALPGEKAKQCRTYSLSHYVATFPPTTRR